MWSNKDKIYPSAYEKGYPRRGIRERERKTDRQTHRQTDSQTDRQTDSQTDRPTHRQIDRESKSENPLSHMPLSFVSVAKRVTLASDLIFPIFPSDL